MPVLRNVRHERFARSYTKLGVGRHAYVEAGYKAAVVPQDNAPADVCASKLLRHPKVIERIQELRRAMGKRADVTEESLLDELEEARISAAENKQSGAMVAATMGKAKLTGLVVDRKEVGQPGDFERMNETELRAFIAANLAGQSNPLQSQQEALQQTPTHQGSDTKQ